MREKSARPVAGFCGFAYPLKTGLERKLKDAVKTSAGHVGIQLGKPKDKPKLTHLARTEALRVLSKSRLIDTNFIVEDRFLGGAQLSDGSVDPSRWEKAQLEFVQNLTTSDYILCARGAGNFSYRLYEALSCGRIPIFLDTDCVLPYDFVLDWKKYCVWVHEGQIPKIADKLVEFHGSLSSREFVEMQRECRKLWENWLSPEGFFANLHRHLEMTTK